MVYLMGTSDQRGLPHKQTLNVTVAAIQAEIKIAEDPIKYGESKKLEDRTLVHRHGKVPRASRCPPHPKC
jgi:hypothetical protein